MDKKVLNETTLGVVVKTGYYHAEEIKTCVDKKIKVYIKVLREKA